ncbi:MAG: hypothetical protein CVT98_06980 [Bacteroidetes bacterium HGW-Bacteroidetes-15]|nr:MAG: hypothetical protein CVT98_06980 [Bacteroidetes bacterium HGW-Bacteroidetes-15]
MSNVSAHICQCKAVKAHEIKKAVRVKEAQTLLDIQNLTKAATGCGRCKQSVTDILNDELKKIRAKGKQLRFDF